MMVFVGLLLLTNSGFRAGEPAGFQYQREAIAGPQVYGNTVTQTSTVSGGFLLSYRYMLTPRSALEVNYGWAHNSQIFSGASGTLPATGIRVHTRQQEFTGAYVYTRNYPQLQSVC